VVNSESQEQYVTIKKVAESAGVTVETVRRWDREGKLKISGSQSSGMALLPVYRCAAVIERSSVLHIRESRRNHG